MLYYNICLSASGRAVNGYCQVGVVRATGARKQQWQRFAAFVAEHEGPYTGRAGRGASKTSVRMAFLANRGAARSPQAELSRAQRIRKGAFAVLTMCSLAALVLVEPRYMRGDLAGAALLAVSLALIAAGVTIRVWAAMYVAGRKSAELVAAGPYAMVRNPLYVGTLLCVAGASLAFGSLLTTAAITLGSFAILHWIIQREETRLLIEFGEAYRAYMDRVPRWAPRGPALNREWMEVRVANVTRALVEALLFFAALPVAALVSAAHEQGWVRPVLSLP